ncbi:MAG TPA: SRPBCC family protein [Propionibacteriaceae bacterium]|jgi:carbon monoxide dehydrogenase subunit G|nr:SRPBCC family protein [Propionibacteriaceae bacterium]
MDLTHRFSVPASVDETWTAFNHLDRLAPCFPGATISSTNGDHFEGSIKIKLGSMALVYSGSGRFLERDIAAHRLVFQASGDERRGNGTARATVTASLVGNGSGTDVELITDLDFTGRPAQFGSGVVSDVSDKLVDQFVSCVSVRFADGLGAPVPEEASAAESVAADDELWEEWATADESGDAEDLYEEQPTVEMAAVGTDAATPVEDDTGLADEVSEPEPAPPPTAPPLSYRYTPPSDLSRADAHVVSNVVTNLLRRYGPLLGLLSLVVVIVIQIINRRRR